MQTLKHLMIAITVLAAFAAAPASAKTLAEEIWDQANQTTPHRPSNDEFRDALP
jgi:hypothetical protein